jgi:hypothetical protein
MSDAGNGASLAGKVRAQRFRLQIPLRYRVNRDSEWRRGVTTNISYTGMLFRGEGLAEPGTPIEIRLVLPCEMTKQRAAEVVCRGTVTRAERPKGNGDAPIVATRILHYRFVRP